MWTNVFITVGIVAGLSVVLAAMLVLAEKLFADYGICKITINGKKEVSVKGGGSLLSALTESKIFIPSACGGRGSCGFCKCKVTAGGGPLLPTEKPYLNQTELADDIRLGCQVKVKGPVSIEIPEDLFNVKKFRAVIAKIEDYTYDTKGITFKLTEPTQINFKAGQYVQLITPKYGKVKESVTRAYSISSTPDTTDSLQLIIRRVPDGICTTWVHDYLKEGDQVELTGPFGDFFIRDTDADMIFVAGGSGKAPIKSMMEYLVPRQNPRRKVYFFGARTIKDLYLTEHFTAMEKSDPDFTYVPVLSNPEPGCDWSGRTGYTTAHFAEFVKNPANTEAYLCGSPGMIASVVKTLTQMGVPKEKIYYDSFA